ncbi:MAG TPA: carbohydrate-binding protein, partial [Prolixibacteraceae bacterium]|nr:carbohydrate-binding protein [Prolixibacteraceae bacterium]
DGAGLRIMRGDETFFVKLFITRLSGGEKGVAFSYDQTRFETGVTSGDTVWLKMVRVNHKISGYFSADGMAWHQVGSAVDVSAIDSYSDFSSFTGTRQGLFVEGSRSAWFDLYLYRDAFTPILAECPANQQGVTRTAPSQGISNLDQIGAGDWALYAGVAFGDGELYPPADSVVLEAACLGDGGTVELWLDSLDTGRLIGSCNVTASGGWNTFRKFSAPVERVTGTHDLYLKFMGGTSPRLFVLRWITFTRKNVATSAGSVTGSGSRGMGGLTLYPNPSAGEVHLVAEFPFHTLEIFTLKGERLFQEPGAAVHRRSLVPPVPAGTYVVRVTGKAGTASALLVVER